MPIERDKKQGAFVFVFDRRIDGQRVRARKRLPTAWSRAQVDAFDRKESARLYALATGAGGQHHLIDDAVELYIKHRLPELKSARNTAMELNECMWAWQGRPLSALADVAKVLQTQCKHLAPATIKNRISYLRAACRYAWKHHNLGDTDPGARVTVPAVKNERQRYITREQLVQICRLIECKQARAFIRVAFYTGMRFSEIVRAERSGDIFILRDTKNGDPRYIPIHPKIKYCADFQSVSKFKVRYHLYKACTALGIEDFKIHDLRHSTASALINSGSDLYTVGAVLGHKSTASTKRYAHLDLQNKAIALARIGKRA